MRTYNSPTTTTLTLLPSYMVCLGTSVTQVSSNGPIEHLGDQYIEIGDAN